MENVNVENLKSLASHAAAKPASEPVRDVSSTGGPQECPQLPYQFEMARRQEPLALLYKRSPDLAWVGDDAVAGTGNLSLSDPLHTAVRVAGVDIPVGVHRAVGGDSDDPVPGELLSAALAACLESTIRVIANRLNVGLTFLEVTTRAEVDVRGTLRLSRDVPIGFQKITVNVDIAVVDGVSPALMSALLKAAETSCVVMQTLRQPPEIDLNISRSDEEGSISDAL